MSKRFPVLRFGADLVNTKPLRSEIGTLVLYTHVSIAGKVALICGYSCFLFVFVRQFDLAEL